MLRSIMALALGLGIAGCGDDSGPITPRRDAGPGGRADGGSSRSDAGPGGGSDAGPGGGGDAGPGGSDAGPAPSGACTNAADTSIHESMDVNAAVQSCASSCLGAAMCVTDCVVRDTGLSRPCSQCYGDVAGCTVMNCALQCIGGGDSPACMMCRDEMGCTEGFSRCSGFTE